MEKVDTLVVDKTGTLTEGKPSVTAIVAARGFSEDDVLRFSAGVERASEHPLATAIVEAAEHRNIAITDVSDFDSPTGKGVLGMVEGRKIVLGNAHGRATCRGRVVSPCSSWWSQYHKSKNKKTLKRVKHE